MSKFCMNFLRGSAFLIKSFVFLLLSLMNSSISAQELSEEASTHALLITPSFNCSKAHLPTEKAICADLELANLDVYLSQAYRNAKRYLTGDAFRDLKGDQIRFIKKRNNCKDSKICLVTEMQARHVQLQNAIDQEQEKPNPIVDESLLSQKLDGLWEYERWAATANCLSNRFIERMDKTRYTLSIMYPYVMIKKQHSNNTQTFVCQVSDHSKTSFAKVDAYLTELSMRSFWGTCRSDVSRLPYRGDYTLLTLTEMKLSSSEANPSKVACGYLVLSGSGDNYSLVYGPHVVDQLFLGTGSIFKKVAEY